MTVPERKYWVTHRSKDTENLQGELIHRTETNKVGSFGIGGGRLRSVGDRSRSRRICSLSKKRTLNKCRIRDDPPRWKLSFHGRSRDLRETDSTP